MIFLTYVLDLSSELLSCAKKCIATHIAVFVYSVSKIVYNLKPCVIDLREQLVRRKHMPCYPVDKASLITYES